MHAPKEKKVSNWSPSPQKRKENRFRKGSGSHAEGVHISWF